MKEDAGPGPRPPAGPTGSALPGSLSLLTSGGHSLPTSLVFKLPPAGAAPCTCLPADGVQRSDLVPHVLVHVETIDDGIDLEGHFVVPTPAPQFLEILHVVELALTPADKDIDLLVEAITGDGKYIQIFTWGGNDRR